MKNFIALFLIFSAMCFGQENSMQQNKALFPLYIVDGNVSNETLVKLIDPKEMLSISIYKFDNLPENLVAFTSFAEGGIVDVYLKDKDDSGAVSFERLNVKNNLNELNPVYINGILFKNTSSKIMEEAIFDSEIIEKNGQKFLSIWTVSKKERIGIAKRTDGNKKDKDLVKNLSQK